MRMIEKIARAMARIQGVDSDGSSEDWLVYGFQYQEMTRAAVEALMEPSEEILAATATKELCYLADTLPDEAPRAYWQAILQAILDEKE